MYYWFFIIPIVSAFIGWSINRIGILLLFYPRSPKRILGLPFHGQLPKRQHALACKIGALFSAEFSSLNIEQKITDPASLDKLMPLIEDHVDDFLRNKLKQQMPMISMFIGDKTIESLKTIFLQELKGLFPQVMKQFAGDLKTELDIEQTVVRKIAAFPMDKLQQLLVVELRFAAFWGALSGFLIGLVQVLIIVLSNY